jgi:hypothetical protein
MTTPAHVTSIEALHAFRGALIRFVDEATSAIDSLRQEVLRTMEWIEHDRPGYWKQQVKRSYDGVAQARTQLEIAQMRMFEGQGPSCIEEKKRLATAKARLQFAEDQIQVVRHWAIKLQRESDDFRGRTGQLEGMLKRELPMAIGKLQRMVESLDRYAERLPRQESADVAATSSGKDSKTAAPEPES